MTQDLPWLEEELAAHSHWVRRLARSLVHDETAAEDLVQDTWVAALRKPPSDRRALRSWLGRVVRTLAWKQQRKASTAPLSADEGSLPAGASDMELVERLELHRVLAEELRAIREPVRTTLLQRYIEGMSAAEIAERTSVPAPTVRWRLQQGLEELRTRLDARFGGNRETWMSALAFALPSKGLVLGGAGTALGKSAAALDGSGAALGGSGLAIGEGVLMSTLVKVSLGAALLVAAVMLALPFVAKDEVPVHVPALANSTAQPIEAPPATPPPPSEPLTVESAAAERASLASDAKPTAAVPATDGKTRVVARILDESLRPIAKSWLCTVDNTRQSHKVHRESAVESGSDGTVTLEWTGQYYGYPETFALGAHGFAMQFSTGTVKRGETLQLGDLILRPGGAASGRIVDAAQHAVAAAEVLVDDSAPTAGAGNPLEALKMREPGAQRHVPTTESADDGSFLLDNVAIGTTRVWARVGKRAWTISAPLEITAGGEVRGLVLVVDAESESDPELRDVEGIVLDPDGSPVDAAQVAVSQWQEGGSWSSNESTGSDGRFRIHPRAKGVKIALDVEDSTGRYVRTSVEDIKPGTSDLVIRLEQPKTIPLSVRDANGPLENFRVTWGEYPDLAGFLFADETGTHAGGRATVRVMASACYFQIAAPGYQTGKLGPIYSRRPPAELSIELRAIPGIHGRVLAGGKPVAGAKLSLYVLNGRGTQVKINGFATRVNSNAGTHTTSDSDGRFTLDLQRDGTYSIFADAEGYARLEHGPLPLEARAGVQDLELQLDAGGALEGKVLMPPGRSCAGVIVGINRGDAQPITRTVGADGRFRFEHLTPGSWEIQRADQEFRLATTITSSSGPDVADIALRHDFEIAGGQTTHKDLDLSDAGPCVIEIQLSNNTQAGRAWSVLPRARSGRDSLAVGAGVTCDASGHARLAVPDPGEYTLTVTPPPESGSAFQFEFDLALQRGTNFWAQDIQTGRVEGTIASWKPDDGFEWHIKAQDERFAHLLTPDAAGRFVLPLVATGKLEIHRARRAQYLLTKETIQSFDLARGETKTLQLP